MKLESCRNYSGDEIETTITMLGNGSEGFRVYTTSNSMLIKIGKFLDDGNTPWSIEKIERYSDGVPSGYFFKCTDCSCLSLRAKRFTKNLSAEARSAASERMKNISAVKKA